VWSLGVVLYETLTGKNPFEGETVSDSLAAVIHVEPAPLEDVPEELQRIARKALKKKAGERYQSIKDLALDLKDLRAEVEHHSGENRLSQFSKTVSVKKIDTDETATLLHQTISADHHTREQSGISKTSEKSVSRPPKRAWLFPLAIIFAAAVLAFGMMLPRLLTADVPLYQSIQASRLTDTGAANLAEISPDGKFVAFVSRQEGRRSLVVQQVSTRSVVQVLQPSPLYFYQPSFSPDGDFIYYVTVEKGIGTLYQVPTLGGESKKIIVDVDSKVSFSPDGKRIAFVRHNPNEGGDAVILADADGANPQVFLNTKDIDYDQFVGVDWSPDNDKLLVGVFKNKSDPNQKLRLATVELDGKHLEYIGEKGWLGLRSFEWIRSGAGIVLVAKANSGENSQVWMVSYPSGEARQVTTDTTEYESASVSQDGGTLVTTRIDAVSSLWSRDMQTREMRQVIGENRNLIGSGGIAQMPNGKILYVKITGRDINIFSAEANGEGEKQLTSGAAINQNPIPTPDGKYIVFISNRAGAASIWRMNADGSNQVQLSNDPNAMDTQVQVTKDSRSVIFMRSTSDSGRSKLMKVSIDGGDAVPVFAESAKSEFHPRISADGKMLAYYTFEYDTANPNIETRIEVVGLDGEKAGASVAEFNSISSHEFRFSPDGKAMTYLNRDGIDNIWNVSLENRKETPLTDFNSGGISNFAWAHDGKKLFIVRAIYNSDLVLIKDSLKN
jgi:Tol biopolymer transport system component